MPEDVTIWPVAMTKRGGILGSRSNRIPAYIAAAGNDTVEYPEVAPDGLDFTLEEYRCFTFYVNSRSNGTLQGPTETGDGSKENPFCNLNSIFSSNKFLCYIQNFCCQYVKVIITGTIDYYIDGRGRDFAKKLILDFHTALIINWSKEKHGLSVTVVQNCVGVVFSNFEFTTAINHSKTQSDGQVDIYTYCFSGCTNCIFYNNTGEIRMKNSVSGTNANDHAALYVEYFKGCSGVQILSCNITVDMNSQSQETDNSDASVAHTRTAIVYGSSNVIIIKSKFNVKCVSFAGDNSSGSSFVAGIAQAFGLYSCSNAILSQTSISCSARAGASSYKESHIACALGSTAQYHNCSFSPSVIVNNGTNGWTSSYSFTCYK